MFRIKKRNLDAFVAHEERAFEARVLKRLRDNFEALRGKSEDELRAFVRLGRARAAEYAIDSPYGISLYVGVMAELGIDFDRSGAYPWATALLTHPGLDGNARAAWLCDEAAARSPAGPEEART